jgi:hypothetical protein
MLESRGIRSAILMSECQKLYVVRTDLRPADVPDDWVIFNAPRPMYGSMTWQGDWCRGIYYAAVDPAEPEALAECRRKNGEWDGRELVFVTEDEAISRMRAHWVKMAGERAEAYVANPNNRAKVIEAFENLVNSGKVPV